MRPSRHGALLALTCLICGCWGRAEVELLALERVAPELLEPGGGLEVMGSGLPVGRSCEVTLEGVIHRPGAVPRQVSATVAGRAVSDELVTAVLDDAAFAELGAHGSFQGTLTLAFEARESGDVITGRVPAVLDLADPMARGAAYRQSLRARALEALSQVGIVPAESASTLSGLEIDWTTPGSTAERAGLKHGDVIEVAAGVRVHAPGDVAPAPATRMWALEVRTPPAREARPITLSLAGLDGPRVDVNDARLGILLCFVVICLLLWSPLPTPGMWLSRLRSRLAVARAPSMGLWGGALPEASGASGLLARADRIARRWLWPAALSLGAMLMVLLEPVGLLRLRSLSIYLAFAALSVGLTLLSESGTARERLRTATEVGGRMLVLMVLLLCACALSGSRTFDGMVAGQGGWPWQWALFREPALLLSFPLFVMYAARLGAATLALGEGHSSRAGRRSITMRLLVGERVLTNVVLSGIGAAVYAGGWQCPLELHTEHLPPRLIGALLFVIKCWGLAWVLHLARRLELGVAQRARTTALVCLGVIALTALGVALEPSVGVKLTLGKALFGAFAIASWVGLTQALTGVHPMGVPLRPAVSSVRAPIEG